VLVDRETRQQSVDGRLGDMSTDVIGGGATSSSQEAEPAMPVTSQNVGAVQESIGRKNMPILLIFNDVKICTCIFTLFYVDVQSLLWQRHKYQHHQPRRHQGAKRVKGRLQTGVLSRPRPPCGGAVASCSCSVTFTPPFSSR
jgi:hypothetical protein